MAFNAEQLNIVIAARTQELQKELGAAERRIKRFESQTRNSLGGASASFASLGKMAMRFAPILGGAGLIDMARNATSAAREIQNLSMVAGTSIEQFQRIAYAASTVGIEQQKLSDILKDVNDKIGDFMQTGAGPMADFFENIGPKVGVTAEQFRNLSGPDALQLYVSSLEKAGVSQKEMTFYMEALASDATALAPLLRDGGAAMDELGQKAQDLGIVLGEDTVRQMAQMDLAWSTIMDSMSKSFQAFAAYVVTGFDNIFGITAYGRFNQVSAAIATLEGEASDLQTRIAEAEASGGFAVDEFSGVMGAGVTNIEAARDRLAAVNTEMEVFKAEAEGIQITLDKINQVRDTSLNAPDIGGANGIGGGAGGKKDAALERLKAQLESERELIDEYRMSEMEKLVADHEMRQQILEEALQKQLLTQEEYNRLKAENQSMHSQEIAKIIAAERSVRLGETANMFSALAGIAEQGGKKLVKTQAILSGAATMIAAYEAATKAAAEATTIPGRIAAYAAFVAKGAATVAQIKSIGASGSASGGSAGGSIAAPAAPAVSRNVAINLAGGDMYSRDQVINLINGINEAVEDGATLRLV